MTKISDLLGRVSPSVPGCPSPVIEDHLRFAAKDFCRRTLIWTEELAVVELSGDNFPYQPSPPYGAKVTRVLSVVMNGVAPGLDEISIREATTSHGDWRTATGVPRNFVTLQNGYFSVVPLPDGAEEFGVSVAYEPEIDATDLPDMLDDWVDNIVSGAISRLANIPGKPWSSDGVYANHRQLFEEGIDNAKVDLHRHYVMPTMITSPAPI